MPRPGRGGTDTDRNKRSLSYRTSTRLEISNLIQHPTYGNILREYGQIQSGYWTDPDIQSLSSDARLLGAYLLTGPHSNGLGCFRLPNGYVEEDLGWSPERVGKGFGELFEIGFSTRCGITGFVLIPKFIRWNPISNGNVAKARRKEFNLVPKKASIYSDLCLSLLEHGKYFGEQFETLLQTLAKPYTKQDPDPDPTQNLPRKDPEPENNKGSAVAKNPPSTPKNALSTETWSAYSQAYDGRYGVEPVRNAKVNGQLSQLVKRLGGDMAPVVAAFYLTHNNSYYIRQGHSVDCLLADAEKLHTECVTGNAITGVKARQLERTNNNLDVVNELIAEARQQGAPQ